MASNEKILDFIHYAFIITLSLFLAVYFIAGDMLADFTIFLESLIPLMIFSVLLLLAMKFERIKFRIQKINVTLYLDYSDKLRSDILIFSLPALILLIVLFSNEPFQKSDVLIASVTFIFMMLWKINLFKNSRIQKTDDKYEIVLYLARSTIFKSKVIVFLLPMTILIIILIIERTAGMVEVIQASVVFLMLYSWEKILFRKV